MAKKTQTEPAIEQNPPSGGRWIRLPDGTLVRAGDASKTAAPEQENKTATERE